jgi:branched-chain amino acid transport system substrate-binding protein
VVLLGLNGWNSPDLLEGGKYLRDALFVDAFLPTDPSVDGFVHDFQQELGRKPIVVDAMAYDAARLVIQATRKAGADRVALHRGLAEARIDAPVARGDHFGPDHALARDLYVLTLSSQGITLADTAANPETP